jgi:oligopeptide transport system permease protein
MRLFKIGIAILSLIFLMAIFGPYFSPYTYSETHLIDKNLPPSVSHWFGTDDLGRDLFTRVCYGARISLFVGAAAAFIDLIIGMLWGGVAALAGGNLDRVMMRIADLLFSLPYLLIVILLLVTMGPGLITIIVAMSVIGWITMARIVRGQILYIKEQEYVLAAKCLGAGFFRILFQHILPNAKEAIVITLTLTISSAIFTEAFLSFLGLGVQAPAASWGTMANEGLAALQYYPWRLFFPSIFISLTIFSLNLVGDGLRYRTK